MSKLPPTYKAILTEIARGSDRSSLFWWLVDHHNEIAEHANGRRLMWKPLCALFAQQGLTDIHGRPPTQRTARETWYQARRAVAEAQARKLTVEANRRPGQTHPSRVSPDWRPRIVPQPQPAAPSSPVAPPARLSPLTPVIAPPPTPGMALKLFKPSYPGELVPQKEVDAMIAGVFEQFKEMDRRTFGGFIEPHSQTALPKSIPNKDPERESDA